ncbi:hypothetical protein [Streptomyces sp. NPDC048639]|uniref:hypothetical protein n=1 Tax=Streptomyces sp. NPDC048639 TaxID=3365581 RepID=UPI003719089D
MISPGAIPQFTGKLEELESDAGGLKGDAGKIRKTGSDIHSKFQGLSAYYKAPEAEQLFATTKPVADKADAFADDLEKVSSALTEYATEVRPIKAKLEQLKNDATNFVEMTKEDDEWQYDGDKVEEHNQLRDDITAAVAAFWAAERSCHNKITALVNGTQMVAGDGSDRKNQYGFDAEDMKNAKLPWGDPVDEKHHWYEVGHWVKSFVWDGVIVDGVWGTLKGLGTLVGFGGWEAFKQSWTGLAKLATGLALTAIPGVGTAFLTLPDDKLPSWIRDSRTAMKETGKALVAWDQWGKNPGRAAGAVTFNVVTTVVTGGAGAGVSGAGKAGAVAKVLSTAGKAGRFIDPMTYITKGAGAGLSKIGDVMAGLKGVGNIEVPTLPEGAISLPEGAVKLPEGTVKLPEGATLPEGAVRIPEGGAIKLPEGTPIPAGATDLGNGAVKLPEGTPIPEGAVKLPEGTVKLPEGATVVPEGAVKLPTEAGAPAQYLDNQGNILDDQGNLIQHADGAPRGADDANARPPAEMPRVETPVREPALVGAHVSDNAAHMGDNVGDSAGRFDDALGGFANHTPGGGVTDLPTKNLDNAVPGGRAHAPSNGLDNAVPSGAADTGLRPGGPGGPLLPSNLDDLAGRFGDDAFGDAGRFGDDAVGDAGRIGDEAGTPANQADEGSGTAENGQRERTAAEQERVVEEQILKANEDPTWFEKHYRPDGHRWSIKAVDENQNPLPILAKDSDGNWIARDSMPSRPGETRLAPATPLGRDSVPTQHLSHLDDVAMNRRVALDLESAERAFKNDSSHEMGDTLKDAQDAYHAQLGDTPNNSSISEQLGEDAAKFHVIPEKFPDAQPIPLPKTPNGANMFDQLYKLDDGSYLVVEAKAPSGNLIWRQGAGSAKGFMVQQGTKHYVHAIIAEMQLRSGLKTTDAVGNTIMNGDLARDLLDALDSGKLKYVLVKANDNTGTYAGASLEHFKIG